MNSLQIVFLILILLPLIVSIFTKKISLLLMYIVEYCVVILIFVFYLLGTV